MKRLLLFGVAIMAVMGLLVVAFFVLPVFMEQCDLQPQGQVLLYEVDPEGLTGGKGIDLAKLCGQVDRRLNSGSKRLALVRQLDDRQIEVAVYSASRNAASRVERLMQLAGTLEFRVLANNRNDKKLIDLALADPSKTQILDEEGNLLAWWVAVKAGEEQGFAAYPEIARRTRKQGDCETEEILVVKDIYDVTGAYLTRADAGTDRNGRPCINFSLT